MDAEKPSKKSKAAFLKIDKIAVLNFAIVYKKASIKPFELLASVSVNIKLGSFILKNKRQISKSVKVIKL
ncbi:hypothetical protein BTO04_14790 [Polaribacter sp. SA4-10]|nr:hypothetical protein BTO04_14790 [Polaribacter sp. SA4-10]